ncbi:uncharacterized protein LOC122663268 [Telopea speciosissima]|uniref:uncharacterized protein LOC122663268 n=1 Tax=Telopea speciosissima TaxID=54955 RepID=UPI001CC59CD9|nr:uncharacterized protein LOC122663268 [Telopea speciosissima]
MQTSWLGILVAGAPTVKEMSWSSSDNFFVSSKLEVFSIDLSSKPLELTQSKAVVYDGPKGDDFKKFLRSKNLRVNRQGKAIVRIQKRDNDGEFLECQYDNFVLEMVVPLGPFGFQNLPLPKPQAVNELESLLGNTKAELGKKNDDLNELQNLLNNTKAELVKKNDALNELQSLLDNNNAAFTKKNDALNELMKLKIDQDLNHEKFRLTMIGITNSMKRVFVDFGLEPPASEDPEYVLRLLHDLILQKEIGATFLVAANEILASIASMFHKRSGLSIGMETNSLTTPARLIKVLFTLRGFMESRFFIDGSVMVKDLRLMNEEDLPVIFQDSAADVAELKQNKEMGTKSIDNIDRNSIFYGYFNIPTVGMFKGVLTRVHFNLPDVTLPDEIMVKLRVGKHNLKDKRFWFVYANGSGIFQKEPLCPEDVKFSPSRFLGGETDFLGFLLKMNRTFVNKEGTYLKFDFIATKSSTVVNDNILYYLDKDFALIKPFRLVQFDVNESAIDIIERKFSAPTSWTGGTSDKYASWIVNEGLGNDSAFTLKGICFIGKITKTSGSFRSNALVSVFFEHNQHRENCYVDALATTFFVLKTEKITSWNNGEKKALEFI